MPHTPPPASTPSLEDLSAKATPGEWRADYDGFLRREDETRVNIGAYVPCINGLSAIFTLATLYMPDEAEEGMTDGARNRDRVYADAAFIVALVNAYRAGAISPAAGRAAVVEECARVADVSVQYWNDLGSAEDHGDTSLEEIAASQVAAEVIAEAIRALAPASPTGGQASSPVVTEAEVEVALDAYYAPSPWREPYTSKQGENMRRADMRRALEAALPARAAEQAGGWQDIASIPPGDVYALVAWETGSVTVEDIDHDSDVAWWRDRGATHWQPLPHPRAPPNSRRLP